MSVLDIARGNEGALYACGGNDSGQLCLEGIGESRGLRYIQPSVVGPVVYVAAGGSHTYVISSSTTVFGCGSNARGQLAVTANDDAPAARALWMQCSSFMRLKIIQIACGESHTMALATDGELFTWGAGDGGRLGLGDVRSRSAPERVPFFRGRSSHADDGGPGTIGSISCGYHHSMAVTGAVAPSRVSSPLPPPPRRLSCPPTTTRAQSRSHASLSRIPLTHPSHASLSRIILTHHSHASFSRIILTHHSHASLFSLSRIILTHPSFCS